MSEVSTIGLDLAKEVQVLGADAAGAVVFRKRLRQTAVVQFLRLKRRAELRWRPARPRLSHRHLSLGSSDADSMACR